VIQSRYAGIAALQESARKHSSWGSYLWVE
jgi:hypothetical protein